jgi:hypothetical protein
MEELPYKWALRAVSRVEIYFTLSFFKLIICLECWAGMNSMAASRPSAPIWFLRTPMSQSIWETSENLQLHMPAVVVRTYLLSTQSVATGNSQPH